MRIWSGRGRLVVTKTLDGRVLLRMEDGSKGGQWLELMAGDVLWLINVLTMVCPMSAIAGDCSAASCCDG